MANGSTVNTFQKRSSHATHKIENQLSDINDEATATKTKSNKVHRKLIDRAPGLENCQRAHTNRKLNDRKQTNSTVHTMCVCESTAVTA